jgi:hypothetical protein
MTKMMNTETAPSPMNAATLARAQVVRGNDPLSQSGSHYFTHGNNGERYLYQEDERLWWQPEGQIAKDCTPRWRHSMRGREPWL